MSLAIELNRYTLAVARVNEPVFRVQLENARLVINFDHKLFDEVTADDPIEVVSESRGQASKWNRQDDRLRKISEAFQFPCRTADIRAKERVAAGATDANFPVKIQAQFLCAGNVDYADFVAGIKDK